MKIIFVVVTIFLVFCEAQFGGYNLRSSTNTQTNLQSNQNAQITSFSQENGDCQIDLNYNLDEPIFIDEYNQLLVPESGSSKWIRNGGHILLDCGEGRQFKEIKYNNEQKLKVQCKKNKIKVVDQSRELTTIPVCTKSIFDIDLARVLKTNTQCGSNLKTIYQIGFKVSTGFLPYIDVCFDDTTKTAQYTKHIIYRDVNREFSSYLFENYKQFFFKL
jgi:hypothetical protein